MTLRQLIKDVGVNPKTLRDFKEIKGFRSIENCDIFVHENISDNELLKYFNSKQFKEDIPTVMKGIDCAIKSYPNHSLKHKNFYLFFSETTPLKLNAHALIF